MKDSPRNGRPVSRTVTCAAVTASIDQSSHKSVRERSAEPGVLSSNMFAHMKKDLAIKIFRSVFLIELSDTAMRRCHETCAFLSELFPTTLSRGQVLLSEECSIYRICPSRNVFGPNSTPNTRLS